MNFRDTQTDQNRKNADQGWRKVINLSQNRTDRGRSSENHPKPKQLKRHPNSSQSKIEELNHDERKKSCYL